jgi:hypothetical protein
MRNVDLICHVYGCRSPVRARNKCNVHYQRMLVRKLPAEGHSATPLVLCSEPWCLRFTMAKGLCGQHYQEFRRNKV